MPEKIKRAQLQAGLLAGGAGLVILWLVSQRGRVDIMYLAPIYLLYAVTSPFFPSSAIVSSLVYVLSVLLFVLSLGLAAGLLFITLSHPHAIDTTRAGFWSGVLAGVIVAVGSLAWQGIQGLLFFGIEIISGGLAAMVAGATAALFIRSARRFLK